MKNKETSNRICSFCKNNSSWELCTDCREPVCIECVNIKKMKIFCDCDGCRLFECSKCTTNKNRIRNRILNPKRLKGCATLN